jgi:hypothetical protein
MISPLVIGICLLPVFVVYEWKVARYPIIPRRFVTNRSVVIAMLIGSFDFVCSSHPLIPCSLPDTPQISFYLSFTYLYSFVYVVKPWYVLIGVSSS